MDPINDWSDCGLATIRAVLAEAITAGFAHSQDPNAIWHGGQQRGYDVTSKDGNRDAKSVRIDEDGYSPSHGATRSRSTPSGLTG